METFEIPAPFGNDESVLRKYPFIQEHGSLAKLLRAILSQAKIDVEVSGFDESIDNGSKLWASIKKGNRKGQVHAISEGRYYQIDVTEDHVKLASYTVSSLQEIVRFIDMALVRRNKSSEIARSFPEAEISEEAKYFEKGQEEYLKYLWKVFVNWAPKKFPALKPVISEAIKFKQLTKLEPFTSMGRLGLGLKEFAVGEQSIIITPLKGGLYQVSIGEDKVLGKGNAAEVIKIVLQELVEKVYE